MGRLRPGPRETGSKTENVETEKSDSEQKLPACPNFPSSPPFKPNPEVCLKRG